MKLGLAARRFNVASNYSGDPWGCELKSTGPRANSTFLLVAESLGTIAAAGHPRDNVPVTAKVPVDYR